MIKDLQIRQGEVDLVVEVVEIGEVKEFSKFGKTGKVATAKVKDESGDINLSLWNEQVDMIKPGDKVHITNGYVNEFQGDPQLTTGKFGKLEVVESGEGADESKEEVPPTQPEASEESSAEESAEEPASIKETPIGDAEEPAKEEKVE